MKKYILATVLLLLSAFSLRAQDKIAVSEFYLNVHDQTANMEKTMKRDQNGNVCALIKIQTTQKGFSFDVGVLGIVEVQEDHPAEIWVYVPFGVKRISIYHPELGSLLDWYFPCSIEKARTYIMKLITGEVQTIVKPSLTQQYVMFRLSPPNAVVELDNKMLVTTDGVAQDRKAFGKYGFRVTAPLYYPEVGKVEVNDPKNKHIVEVKLRPAFTTVTLKADPGTEIWVNGEKKGTGSWTGDLGYDTYLVETKKAGHRPSQQEVTISEESANQTISLNKPSPIYGSLDINSTPADADIYVDDKKIGTTPMFIEEQLIGSHVVKILKQGYKDHSTTVEVSEGNTATVTATLEKGISLPSGGNSQVNTNGNVFTVKGVSFKMIPVEGGTFTMGATSEQEDTYDAEKPTHQVTLSSYYIGETEVTQALWTAVMGNNPSEFNGDNNPVEQVTWNYCQEFIEKLNSLTGKKFRLPTEAEWEYAARGGNKSKGYQYCGSNNLDDVAWYYDNSEEKTHPVRTKQPNELGIYDMSGNVWEWCQDWYDGSYDSGSQTNPQGPSSGSRRVPSRVIRGGSWFSNATKYCRSAYRADYVSGLRDFDLGLRLVLSE